MADVDYTLPNGAPRRRAVSNPRKRDLAYFQTTVRFDRDTELELRAISARNGRSVAESIRLFVEWGLENERN